MLYMPKQPEYISSTCFVSVESSHSWFYSNASPSPWVLGSSFQMHSNYIAMPFCTFLSYLPSPPSPHNKFSVQLTAGINSVFSTTFSCSYSCHEWIFSQPQHITTFLSPLHHFSLSIFAYCYQRTKLSRYIHLLILFYSPCSDLKF